MLSLIASLVISGVAGAAVENAEQAAASEEIERLSRMAKGFAAVELPVGPGRVELRAEQALTVESLRGVQLDSSPPKLGQPPESFRKLIAALPPVDKPPPYEAHGIAPFRFRHFDCEFHYDGRGQQTWPVCQYAATHAFNRLSFYKLQAEHFTHLPLPGGDEWANVSSYAWGGWFKSRGLEPNRWDKLAEAAEAGEVLIPEGRMKPRPGMSRHMVDMEFGGLLPEEELRRQPWYPARADAARRRQFERRYYHGYALAYSEPGRAAKRDGWKTVSIYAWQSFRQTWYGLDRRIKLDPAVPWVKDFLDNVYDAYDIIHLDGYCYEWSPRNAMFALRTTDEGLAYGRTRPVQKPVRLYFSTVVLNQPDVGSWMRNQPLPSEDVRAIAAMQFFTGTDGLVEWCYAGEADPRRPPDLRASDGKGQDVKVVQVGRPFAAAEEAGNRPREFRRYQFLRVLDVDAGTDTARFYRIDPSRKLEDQPPGPESVCTMARAALEANLRAASEPVAALVEGLALVKPLEYTLRHGQVKIDQDMAAVWRDVLPIARRVKLGNLHVLVTYDPAVVHGARPRGQPITLRDFDGKPGLDLVLPADDNVRVFVLRELE